MDGKAEFIIVRYINLDLNKDKSFLIQQKNNNYQVSLTINFTKKFGGNVFEGKEGGVLDK